MGCCADQGALKKSSSVMTPLRLTPVLGALVLAACASTPPDLNDDLVVRGKRIGEIQIGMSLASLLAVQGRPVRTAPIPDTRATTYTFSNGLTVGADEKVYWIIADDSRFHTVEGIRPGADQIVARATLGKPRCVESRSETTMYDYGDIYFEAGNHDGRLMRVGVIAHDRPCTSPGG
jgi:hypothetical protein